MVKEKGRGGRVLAMSCGAFGLGAVGAFALAAWLELTTPWLAGYALGFSSGVRVSFWEVLWSCLRWPGFVWLLGFTAFGAWMVPVAFALRGFLLCFSVACLCAGASGGLLLAFLLFGLDAMVTLPVFFFLGAQSWAQSTRQTAKLWTRPREMPLDFWLKSGAALLCVLCCAGVEYWILPTLLKTVAPLLGAG